MALFYVKKGTTVRMTATVKDIAGALVNPLDLVLKILDPNGTTQTVNIGALTHPSLGVYYFETTLSIAGDYWINFTSTSPTIVEEATVGAGVTKV